MQLIVLMTQKEECGLPHHVFPFAMWPNAQNRQTGLQHLQAWNNHCTDLLLEQAGIALKWTAAGNNCLDFHFF